jgi:hypothetical protein
LLAACGAGSWSAPFARAALLNKLYLQLLLVPAVLLISSVQEFARKGRGTPMPADPPQQLVTSGTYAYIANPMQLGKVLVVAGWGLFWGSPGMVVAALLGLAYSLCVSSPREDKEMAQRFPQTWTHYRQQVRRWWPRWKPYDPAVDSLPDSSPRPSRGTTTQPARLYLRLECGPCRQLAEWLQEKTPTGLQVLPIEKNCVSARITYDPGDSTDLEHGVVALARAFEHINLECAFFGWMLRLPGIAWLAQLVTDCLDPQSEENCGVPTATATRAVRVHTTGAHA